MTFTNEDAERLADQCGIGVCNDGSIDGYITGLTRALNLAAAEAIANEANDFVGVMFPVRDRLLNIARKYDRAAAQGGNEG